VRLIVCLISLVSFLSMPAPSVAKSSKPERIAQSLSSVGRLTRFVKRKAHKLAPRGCQESAGVRATDTLATLTRRLLNEAESVEAHCMADDDEAVQCSLLFVGEANETHTWSASLKFEVTRSRQIPQHSVSCEILG
jgi:hypothetical protein